MKKLLLWRRLCQTFFLVFFIVVPVLNLYGVHEMYGNLLAFNFLGLHLIDPLSALQVCMSIFSASPELASSSGTMQAFPSEMLWGAFFVLFIAFVLGPVFCSWICPYGFFSELVWKVRGKKAKEDTVPSKEKTHSISVSSKSSSQFLKVKFLLFVTSLLAVFFLHQGAILNQFSLPAWYTRFWQHVFLFGNLLFYPIICIVLILCLELALQKRLWCSYICPQSVLITLFGVLLPMRLRVKFTQKLCTCAAKDRACVKACSLNLNPRDLNGADKIACTNCGDCVHACHHACKVENKALRFTHLFDLKKK